MYSHRKTGLFVICLISFFNEKSVAGIDVPPGFEELVSGQTLWLDVTLYGESLGLYEAQVSLENIRFISADRLSESIAGKYSYTPEQLSALTAGLSHPLARNDKLSCSTGGASPGCGYIDTKGTDVIYDENNARVDLFLSSKFLPREKKENVYLHNTPGSRNGFIHQQNINFVADGNYQSLSVQGNGTLGLTDNGYASLDWTYTGQRYRTDSNTLLNVNNAFIRQDIRDTVYFQAGQMDARDIFSNAGEGLNLSQLPIGKVRGVRAGSTVNRVDPGKIVRGSPVDVFLSRDSRVDAYRDNRLLQSFYLSAGAHELDTRGFPPGSYGITLQIYENNQLVRTLSVPYTSAGLSPAQAFSWFLQAGSLADEGYSYEEPEDNRRVLLGGVSVPVTSDSALTAGATALNTVNYEEMAFDWRHGFDSGPLLDGVLASRASYLRGSEGSRGNTQQITYNDGFSLSFYRTAMSAPGCATQTEKRYSYNGCYKSDNITFSVPVLGWSAFLGYSSSQSEGHYVYRSQLPDDDREQHTGLPWEQVYTTRSSGRAWLAGLNSSFTFDDISLSLGVNAFMRRDSGYRNADKGGYVMMSVFHSGHPDSENSANNYSLRTTWSQSRQNGSELAWGGSYSRRASEGNELTVSLNGLNTRNVSALEVASYGGQYGRGTLTLSQTGGEQNTGHALSASGGYNSSFIVDRDGFAWGQWGDGTPASAVTVSVSSEEEDSGARVHVSMDSGGQADIAADRRVLFTVPGYQPSTVSFRESADVSAGTGGEISKGAGSVSLFMTPGKVFNRELSISTRYTWLGRMTDIRGGGLENVIPLNVMSWSPLGGGGFLLETTRPLTALYVMRGDEYLQCPVHVESVRDVVRRVGTLRCSGISLASLPLEERKQADLMNAGTDRHTRGMTAMNGG